MMDNIRPQKRNANKHTQRGMGMLEKSLQRDGWISAQTMAADGEIFDGSARLEVAADKFAGVDPIIVESDGTRPVIVKRVDIPSADDPRARRLSVAANQITAADWSPDGGVLAEWAEDDKTVREMFSEFEWGRSTGQYSETVDPNTLWGGMPEFGNTPKAFRTLYIHFQSEHDVELFRDLVKKTITEKTKYIWFPDEPKGIILEDEP